MEIDDVVDVLSQLLDEQKRTNSLLKELIENARETNSELRRLQSLLP